MTIKDNEKYITIWEKFTTGMLKILEEKESKYDLGWRSASLNSLKLKLTMQLGKLDLSHEDQTRAKRDLLHIANYCYLMYHIIGERERFG